MVGIHGAGSLGTFYLSSCKAGRKIIPVFTCTAFFMHPNSDDIQCVHDTTPLTTECVSGKGKY